MLTIGTYHIHEISIHRSLAGPDTSATVPAVHGYNFNPQVPCGTRLKALLDGETITRISIHRSLAGPDRTSHPAAS